MTRAFDWSLAPKIYWVRGAQLEQLQQERQGNSQAVRDLTDAQRESALQLLCSEHLLERIAEDFENCGLVVERTSKLVAYSVATSRLLERPLGLIVQSTSAAGKSSLSDPVAGSKEALSTRTNRQLVT
ncbi:MAG: hypothetical protein R3C53_24665 [Pirellulaceae bacterium]